MMQKQEIQSNMSAAQTNAISNLTVGQTYYIINIGDADRVKLASTPQLAEVGTAITITSSGTGTQSLNIRSRVYTSGNSQATIHSISGHKQQSVQQ